MIPLHHTPIYNTGQSARYSLFCFLMQRVLVAGLAQFLKFQALFNDTLIFVRVIVGVLAHGAF